ncbi:hypothetical protein POM88_002128 [Heracleum sosnowskyi]|uniref:rRNA N-glycosylase n=1 Tax=Heracleum sosnowskyi TaxID=360622 RepID=A0AAD8JG94_9APIA|nr:hypothetical protein POM88_002128 [Heracleum sosnowskyi]
MNTEYNLPFSFYFLKPPPPPPPPPPPLSVLIPSSICLLRSYKQGVKISWRRGRSQIVPNLTRSAHIGTVPGKYWLFVVKLIYRGRKLEILLQRFRLYLVGYRVANGGWIYLRGEYNEHVLNCLNESFPVFNEHNDLDEPCMVKCGTSYRSLERRAGVERKQLILNRQTLIDAVFALGQPFNESTSLVHVLNLIQMIPEAVRIEEILCEVGKNYYEDNAHTHKLSTSCIGKQTNWSWASRMITLWTHGMISEILKLNPDLHPLDVEKMVAELMAIYPYIRGTTLGELLYG